MNLKCRRKLKTGVGANPYMRSRLTLSVNQIQFVRTTP
jgi:hypothetical protein